MSPTLMETVIIVMVVAMACFLSILYFRHRDSSSERRMRAMLRNTGLDPDIFVHGNTELIVREVRSRCRKCQSEDLCERWLEGKERGDNDFCPNAGVLKMLAEHADIRI